MISERLRQLRQARGLTLEALAQQLGAISKQALSKYEQGTTTPAPQMIARLAAALGVPATELLRVPEAQVGFIAYRRRAALGKRAQEQIEGVIAEQIQHRVRLQRAVGDPGAHDLPIQLLPAETPAAIEAAADEIRARWRLGSAPIASVTETLEAHGVHVIALDADAAFDGIAAVARDAEDRVLAATVVSRRGVPGERQRLNLAHELGHLVLQPAEDTDAESTAFRFAGALLAPAAVVREHVGARRISVSLDELLLLKPLFGMSVQALLRRLRDLDIISSHAYEHGCRQVNRRGWRLHEPGELAAEQPAWLQRTGLRAVSEGLLSAAEVTRLGVVDVPASAPSARRALLRLPTAARAPLLAQQAAQQQSLYAEEAAERAVWQVDSGGDD